MPAGTYSVSEVETVNPVNGNVMLRIPLVSLPPGRAGMSVGVNLLYNSLLYDIEPRWEQKTSDSTWHMISRMRLSTTSQGPSGWQLGYSYELIQDYRRQGWTTNASGHLVPNTSCSAEENLYPYALSVKLPDGSVHPLLLQGQSHSPGTYYYPYSMNGTPSVCAAQQWGVPSLSGTLVYTTVDGSFLRVEVQTGSPYIASWSLYLPDGTRVIGEASSLSANVMQDRNGNTVRVCRVVNAAQNQYITRLVEVLNAAGDPCDIAGGQRYIEINEPLGAATTVWRSGTAPNPTWTIQRGGRQLNSLPYVCEQNPISGEPHTCYLGETDINSTTPEQFWVPVITNITGPLAGIQYAFDYDAPSAGDPANDGWGELKQVTHPSGLISYYSYANHNMQRLYDSLLDNPVVSRTWQTSQESNQWTYVYAPTMDSTQITGPDGGVTTHYYVQPKLLSNAYHGLVNRVVEPNGDQVVRTWALNRPAGVSSTEVLQANPYVQAEARTVGTGAEARTALRLFAYDKNGNVTSLTETDWGATTLRRTEHTYYGPTADAGTEPNGSDTAAYWSIFSARVRSLVRTTRVNPGSGLTTHSDYSYDPNGNMTEERHYDDGRGVAVSDPLSSDNAMVTSRTYNSYGNLLTTGACQAL